MTHTIFVQDVTLRDGMHAVGHRIEPADVARSVSVAMKKCPLVARCVSFKWRRHVGPRQVPFGAPQVFPKYSVTIRHTA